MSEREEYSGDLSAYLDGELSESRRRRLDEVLQYDQELAGEMDRLRTTHELIRGLPAAQPPRDFAARVVARGERIRLLGTLRRPRSYQWINLAAAAVVLVAAGLSLVIMLKLPSKKPVDTITDVGTLALDTKGTPKDADDTNGKGIDKGAKPSPPRGPYKKADDYKYGKDGPGRGELGGKLVANGRESYAPKGTAGRGTRMRLKKSGLERTLHAARLAAGRLSKGDDEGEFVIYTDSLAFAQADVENVLVYNGIQPVRSTTTAGTVPGEPIRARGGFYNNTQTTGSQVQYEVFASPQQAVKLKNELNVIRAQQKVSQDAMPPGTDAAVRTPKLAKVAPRKIGDGVAEEPAGKKGRDKDKHAPGQAKPKPAKPTLDLKTTVALADEEKAAKAEGKLVTKAKAGPAPETLAENGALPGPAAKPDTAGVAVAGRGREAAPAPTTTAAAGGALAARKTKRGVAEVEDRLARRPDWGQRPGNGEPSAGQKYRTGPRTGTAPARPLVPATAPTQAQAVLAMRQAASRGALQQIESQAGANVMRLLITLNYRDAAPRPTAEALKKAADQKARPAAKIKTNQSH